METLTDLNTFTKILTDKGYDGYFLTQSGYPGKLKESIGRYMEACRKGTEDLPQDEIAITGYLKWEGSDRPSVECTMWVKHEKGTFDLQKIEVTKNDRYGQLLKHSKLTGLSVATVPKANMAIAMVSDGIKQRAMPGNKRHFKL
ncbi:hypothetical protein OOZ15_12480 [Galbibacter sp. EGI 63066]|uniref:hypothetical protein n=1 Tax=Galbibacter sp. EGI 63066 TaxID=2993559 RepID=UPI0022499239|nr:hypothetical protein [Galbibacter sp. EGI 63066]MCX2680761.1 hypothetical protein [Galbibacter sp. EGI 63066]